MQRARTSGLGWAAVPTAIVALASCGARSPLRTEPANRDSLRDVAVEDMPDRTEAAVDVGANADSFVDVPDGTCSPRRETLVRPPAETVLLIDRSGSMTRSLGTGPETRWDVLVRTLAETLPEFDRTIALGAAFFPSAGPCAAPTALAVTPALGSSSAILAAARGAGYDIGTPTSSAIDFASNALASRGRPPRSRSLVLATDGSPNCNPTLDPASCTCIDTTPGACSDAMTGVNFCLDDVRTVRSLLASVARGVPVYVIGIMDAADPPEYGRVLDALATAGGRARSGTPAYYRVSRADEMRLAFGLVQRSISLCTWSVPAAIARWLVAGAALRLDRDRVPRDERRTEGWDFADESRAEVTLHGSACGRAVPESQVTVEIPCSP